MQKFKSVYEIIDSKMTTIWQKYYIVIFCICKCVEIYYFRNKMPYKYIYFIAAALQWRIDIVPSNTLKY